MNGEIGSSAPNGRFLKVRYELLGIIALLILQSFGAIWWAAKTEQRLANLEETNRSFSVTVNQIHSTQVSILQELARLRQAIEDSDCIVGR